MTEDLKGRPRRLPLRVANPGPESDSEEELARPSGHVHYRPPPRPLPTHSGHSRLPPIPPAPLTTTLLPSPNYPLSSPSSSSSAAADESTPPPSTPSVSLPPVDGDSPPAQDPIIVSNDRSDSPQVSTSQTGKIIQPIKSPFQNRSYPRPLPISSPRRPATSPTVSTPDSYTSNSSYTPGSTVSDRVNILVTADSDRYINVDISGAKTPAFIREFIFSKLKIGDEDQSQFSIYRTEIGAFAIGEALTDEMLFDLCREHGDSKGSLKLLVSHSSAHVHEVPPRPSGSLSPSYNTIPPPVLPQYASATCAPLQPKRRSRSRHGSLSSASEAQPPLEVAAGYEADVDNPSNDNRSTMRPPDRQISGTPSELSLPPPSPLNGHRPQAQPPSPVGHPSRSNSPVPSQDRRLATTIDKYGNIVPAPPPPPPLSPNRPTFPQSDDNSLTPPATRLHARSGSDAAADREQVLTNSEQQMETASRHWNRSQQGRLRLERSKDVLQSRERRQKLKSPQHSHAEEPLSSTGSWVVIRNDSEQEQPSTPQEGVRSPPSAGRPGSRQHFTPSRYKPSSPYTGRLPIPAPPRNPPPSIPAVSPESRNPPPGRPSGQPVPNGFFVTWKGEEKGDQKPMPASSSHWNRLTSKSTKSMSDMRSVFSSHPQNQQPGSGGRRPQQLPLPRVNGNGALRDAIGLHSSSGTSLGTPKSYESRAPVRPLPMHGPSNDPPNQYSPRGFSRVAGGLTSPSQDPYPRPQSAIGDNLSPTQRYQRQFQSPSHLDAGDSSRSPRTLSPSRQLSSTMLPFRSNPNHDDRQLNGYSRNQEASRSPPHSPVSPRSPRYPPRVEPPSTAGATTSSANGDLYSEEGSTLRPEDRLWLDSLFPHSASDTSTLMPQPPEGFATLMPPRQLDNNASTALPSSSSAESASVRSFSVSDSDSDPECGTSMWKRAPTERPKSIIRRPELTVQIETSPKSASGSGSTTQHLTFALSTASSAPRRHPSPPPSSFKSATRGNKAGARASTFIDPHDDTWAPRPPPEDVYERLEDFFPGHDLDKPVIDAGSGGTSPTSAEAAIPVPPVPSAPEKYGGVRSRKSIRHVANARRNLLDRSSRADPASFTSAARKRNTKLWGTKLEEVTTDQGNASLESPSTSSGLIMKWVRGELIGKGTYGRVYLAMNAMTGEMIAVKQVEIPRTASDKNDARQITVVQALKLESETLKDLDHPNIVQYLGFEETPENLSIFLEYVPGGSVGSCLKKHGKFDETVTKSFTAQILSGLEYLHSKKILHRDLKADNILVEMSGVCKISDFGISKRTDDNEGHTAMQGTVFWMAPEVINTQKKGYNNKIDIWSVGCVVLEMWAGTRPWMGSEAVAVMFKLYQQKLPPPIPDGVELSPLGNDFRMKCFAINPEERPSAAELRKHEYLVLPSGWVFNGFT